MSGSKLSSLILDRLESEYPADYRLLWLADENDDLSPTELAPLKQCTTVVTNRFDVADAAQAQGFGARFSDFDTSCLTEKVDGVIYRVSKERYVSHHCLNAVPGLLKNAGWLILCGKKQEGIKTYFDKAVKILAFQGRLEKEGDWYLARLSISNNVPAKLDDGDYRQVRPIAECFGYRLASKPGVYGWKNIDSGSELLATCVRADLNRSDLAGKSVLDLGCGSGYLTLFAASLGFGKITASDNNAAAVDITRHNCDINGIPANVSADDCGREIQDQFDCVLCNPPFHQGFDTSSGLTDKFVRAAHRLLLPGGSAYFVVNAFIPLEAVAKPAFKKIEVMRNDKKFKVVRLQK